jgi:alkylated DNA repair dioxygenase AlkB
VTANNRAAQPALFDADCAALLHLPEGFAYRAAAIPEAMEATLLAEFERLPFHPFEFHGFLGNRRIVSFGWRYDYAGQALRESEALPDFLWPLRAIAGEFAGQQPERFEQAMVTEYAPGAGIGWHRDKPMFGDIVAFSFQASCRLRFRRKARLTRGTWERAARDVAPRSVYLLRGPAREVWEHSIPALTELRYSVTFRNFKPDARR